MMGFVAGVLMLPLAPLHGMVWLARLLQEIAEKELNDPETLRARLYEAEEAHRRGEISGSELERIEEVVFDQMMATNGHSGGVA